MRNTEVGQLIKRLGGSKAVAERIAVLMDSAGDVTERPTMKAVRIWSERDQIRQDMIVWLVALAREDGINVAEHPPLVPVNKLVNSIKRRA